MGPVCRKRVGIDPDVNPDWIVAQSYIPAPHQLQNLPVNFLTLTATIDRKDARGAVNWLINLASILFSHNDLQDVAYADVVLAIQHLGYSAVAKTLAERKFRLRLVKDGAYYYVSTPRNDTFYQGVWQRRLGRWDRERSAYKIPVDNRKGLWTLMQECFEGECGYGPNGAFEVGK